MSLPSVCLYFTLATSHFQLHGFHVIILSKAYCNFLLKSGLVKTAASLFFKKRVIFYSTANYRVPPLCFNLNILCKDFFEKKKYKKLNIDSTKVPIMFSYCWMRMSVHRQFDCGQNWMGSCFNIIVATSDVKKYTLTIIIMFSAALL